LDRGCIKEYKGVSVVRMDNDDGGHDLFAGKMLDVQRHALGGVHRVQLGY
jgi:hypothetical protein